MHCTKYKPGDRVQVIGNFDELRFSDDPGVDDHMLDYRGTILTITGINEGSRGQYYTVNENYWLWDERWIEPEFEEPSFALEETELISLIGE